MSAAFEARRAELDGELDARRASPELASELFEVVDLLTEQAPLRNALADTTVTDERRRELATNLFGSRLSADATGVVAAAAGLRWAGSGALLAALERQGLRSLLSHAQAAGRLDAVESELFHFSRAVAADPALRQALDDRRAPAAAREQLVTDLLAAKVDPTTLALARRAAGAGEPVEHGISDQLKLAAALRQRAIAVVTVARPLPEDQRSRLTAALVRQLGREVNLQVVVDPAVVGGVRVQVGDEVIEGTVAARLAAAETQLTK